MGEQIWVPIFSIGAVLLIILGAWLFHKYFYVYLIDMIDNKQKDYLKPCEKCLDYFYGPSYDLCIKCRNFKYQ